MATSLKSQADFDNLGRIHKDGYLASVGALFALCWIAAAVRFHVRFGMLKMFSWDDFFLILGLIFMSTMFGLLLGCINDAYATTAALSPDGLTLALRPGFIQRMFNYKKMIDVVLMLAWASILCVKMSYLFLFRRLIDRLRYMNIYWWFVFVYIVGTAGYVFAAYYLVCPYYDDFNAIKCITGDGIARTVRYTVSQIVLDIIGDLFILVFPIHIIWKIKVSPKQKLGLAASLCLTTVIIAVTIIRVAGIITPDNKLDQLWDGYWNVVSAQVGLIMTSATAFRALYINKAGSSSDRRKDHASGGSSGRLTWLVGWWHKTRARRQSSDKIQDKELSAGSNWSLSDQHNSTINHASSADAPQVPRQVLPRGHFGQNTMVSGHEDEVYDSKLRMSQVINDPWDYSPPTDHIDADLLTKRHLIEAACKAYTR